MILHAIELSHVCCFLETVRLGPFVTGLNVLSAPNESGKSTSLNAAARALFDRHTTKSEELKSLQPAGTALAPRISIDFETRAGRYRIDKTFLQKPESQLYEWHSGAWELLADSDAADQRVQALLQSTLPGRGATKPEHWGFLGFLWARQGEPATWPGLDDADVGHRIRARLARVELDPVIEQLRARLGTVADAFITSTGQPRTGGPLRTAEDDLAEIEESLTKLRQTRTDLETAHQRYQQAEASLGQLEKEHVERTTSARELHQQTLATERLRGELMARQQALENAREKLTALDADATALTKLQSTQASTRTALTKAEASAHVAEQGLAQLRTQLDAGQTEQTKHDAHLHELRTEQQRHQALLNLRDLSAKAIALLKQVTKAETIAAEITALEAKRTKLPTLTTAKLRKLEDQVDTVRTLRTQLEALGLTVELTPEHKTTAAILGETTEKKETLRAGKPTRLQRPQSLDLQLTGWGRIVIRSGARDAQNAAADLAKAETALNKALQNAEIPTIEAARKAVAARKDIEAQLKTSTAALEPRLGEHGSIEELREASAAATRRSDALATSLKPTADEQSLNQTDLEAAQARNTEAISAAEKALKTFNKQLDQLRSEERTGLQTVQDATKQVSEHQSHLRTLETQIKDLTARYPDGIETAKKSTQLTFAQAEARVVATKAELPPDFDKLPERNKRAAASLQQIANDLQARRTERDQAKGTLETLGGQGLYSRETELEEKKTEATLRRDAARSQGWSARVAHDLIEHRKQAATKAVLTPLEHRLTAAFAELTGDATREVFLDEYLQIAGIGRTRDSVYAFEQLSQGAKEQLLLCLRLAVAQELATEEPQVLILDDVLVNTDQVRQERILDVLSSHADHLQILILTCHPDRYRGVGQGISITG